MKNYLSIYLFGLIALFAISSCAVNDDDVITEIEEQIAPPPGPITLVPTCSGYGLFSNQMYDCGYKTGVEDYIAYYNDAVVQLGLDFCSEIRVDFTSAEPGEASGVIKTSNVSNHNQIMQLVYVLSGGYRNTINSYQNSSNMKKKGQHDGWYAFYNQVPLGLPSSDCN